MKKMKNTFLVLLSFAFVLNLMSCKENKTPNKVLTQEIAFTKDGTLNVYKKDSDSISSTFNIETAEGDYETQTGLMYRKSLPQDAGMLFLFDTSQPRSFYMKNTEISLDILYINEQKVIEKIYRNAKPMDPSSLSSGTPIKYVLELNGGVSARLDILEGDRVTWKLN
ncbi:hypothetical protein SCB49_01854 [unidentified eubacterium SCB49]|nr:hypothetical protein SCB49_01854 [unidentified eubacterium SCB49]